MTRSAGMTLVEVLVSLAILAVLTLALVQIYSVVATGYRLGSARLELQMHAREAVRRLTPLLTSAVSAGQEAIYAPVPGDSGPEVVFATSENWLDEGQPSFGEAGYPVYRVYRIHFDAENLILEALYSPGTRNRILMRQLYDVEFTRQYPEAVGIRVEVRDTVRGATQQERETVVRLDTMIQIPYYTAR